MSLERITSKFDSKHPLLRDLKWAELITEAFGVAVVVYTGGYVAMEADAGDAIPADVVLTHGVVLGILLCILGRYYIPHLNPVISLSALLTQRKKLNITLFYILFQLIGSLLGALILKAVAPADLLSGAASFSRLGFPYVPQGYSTEYILTYEAIFTFIYTMFFLMMTDASRVIFSALFLMLAGTVSIAIFAMGPLNLSALNPARVFGPALITGDWTQQSVYYYGPIAGGILASIIYGMACKASGKQKKYEGYSSEYDEETGLKANSPNDYDTFN